jgi:hypothetical protein
MMSSRNTKPPLNRWATGNRMATVIVVLGTLAAVWHPGTTAPAGAVSDGPQASARAAATATDSTYFPSRFPAPENVEPQAPTF